MGPLSRLSLWAVTQAPFHFYSLEESAVTSMNPELRRPPPPPPSLLPALPPHVSYSGFGAKSLLAEVEDSLGLG